MLIGQVYRLFEVNLSSFPAQGYELIEPLYIGTPVNTNRIQTSDHLISIGIPRNDLTDGSMPLR